MTQNEKELLLKDLSARLSYNVKLGFYASATKQTYTCTLLGLEPQADEPVIAKTDNGSFYMLADNVKPYLFPMSSMTEEQEHEWDIIHFNPLDAILEGKYNNREEHLQLLSKSMSDPIQWCYENHFDCNGLIPLGLAIDATNLNIY